MPTVPKGNAMSNNDAIATTAELEGLTPTESARRMLDVADQLVNAAERLDPNA